MIHSHFEAVRALKLPEQVDKPGLIVGWSEEAGPKKQPMGFDFGNPDLSPQTGWIDPILMSGEGHLITIAPTGSGKGRGCIIPALLRYDGPVIVIDPKGENVAVTARRRRDMGQKVIIIDPMGLTGQATDSLNPLDLIDVNSADAVDLAAMMAHALIDGKEDPKNRYWYQRAEFLLTAIILHNKSLPDHARHTFAAVRDTLEHFSNPAAGTDTLPPELWELMSSPHPEMQRAAKQMLKGGNSEPNTSVISMANDGVDFLKGPLIEAAIRETSFNLDDVTTGAPLSIYLVLPPHMLESHGRLLRLWVSTLLSLITRRRARPEKSTLFILDECAQLGTLAQLRQIVTLLRGYGVQSWSFWQDVSQLQNLYPADWKTMLNNCSVVQCFAALNLMAAQSMADITGFGNGYDVLELEHHEMILQIAGDTPVIARRPDYLNDPVFAGLADLNPFHDKNREVLPAPHPVIRTGVRAKTDPKYLVPPPALKVPDSRAWRGGKVRTSTEDTLLKKLFGYFE